jgi:cell pole-organizing protein PopZ
MARPNQVPESSMEEILASIRKIISEDEAKPTTSRLTIAPPEAPKPASNVSRLFAEESSAPTAVEPEEQAEEASAEEPVAESAEAEADDAPSELFQAPLRDQTLSFPRYRETESEPTPAAPARMMTVGPATSVEAALSVPDRNSQEAPPPEQQSTLLSPRADAAVAAAFNHLAGTILATNSRTIEQMAEDMMRPMLKEWLDDNLPPLVEKLVREEIERVSRRR